MSTGLKCPYCKKDGMIPPKKPYPYGFCPHCKRRSMIGRTKGKDGVVYIHYSATNLRGLPDGERKRYRSYGVSPNREAEILAKGFKSVQDFLDNG